MKGLLIGIIVALPYCLTANESSNPLPQGKGREETFIYCVSCHSTKIIQQQGLSREDWEETLTWMVEEQGMVTLNNKTREIIINYLVANYSPERPHFIAPKH